MSIVLAQLSIVYNTKQQLSRIIFHCSEFKEFVIEPVEAEVKVLGMAE